MAFHISNLDVETINVSLLIYDKTCTLGGQPWRKIGWFVIPSGGTVIPRVLNVDLRRVNQWTGLYAYTASGRQNWQGTGRAYFNVTNGLHFDQCGDDETNCPKQVDYFGVSAQGAISIISYVDLASGSIHYSPPTIFAAFEPGGTLQPLGRGFSPRGTVTFTVDYVYKGASYVTTHDVLVDPSGQILYPKLSFSFPPDATPATLTVTAVDKAFPALTATTTQEIS